MTEFDSKEQELRSIFTPSQSGDRIVDKLFRAQMCKGNFQWLFKRGKAADDFRKLFRFIDWMMDLPSEVELEFKRDFIEIEQETQMPYITSIERIAKAEGKAEGKIQLLQELVGLPVSSDGDLSKVATEVSSTDGTATETDSQPHD